MSESTKDEDGKETITVEIEKSSPDTEILVDNVTEKIVGEGNRDEKKDDSNTKHLKPGHPRWEEIYWEGKELKRTVAKMEKDKDSDKGLIKEMREHNTKLQETLERMAKASEESTRASKDAIKDQESKSVENDFKDAYEELKNQKKEALEDGNYSQILDIDEKMMDVKLQIRDLKAEKSQQKTQDKFKDSKAIAPSGLPQWQQDDIDAFKGESPWFGTDPFMTGAAQEMENNLLGKAEWKSKSYSEVLKEVKRVVEDRFKYASDNGNKENLNRGAPNAVEGSTGVVGTKGGNIIKMSQEELKLAKNLGVTPEDWARQKSIMDKL